MSLLVVDASAVVAALTGSPEDGRVRYVWKQLRGHTCYAPAVLPFEVTQSLRRLERAGVVSGRQAQSAFAAATSMPIRRMKFDVLARRVWALRGNLSSYDASYVAVAELLDAPLLTLDARLAAAPGPRCEIRTPPG